MIRTWDPNLATGNDQVDNQHRKIFQLFNELLTAIEEEKGHEELGRVMSALSLFVVAHFKMEESLMIQSGYANMAAHQDSHAALKVQVENFVDQFHADCLHPTELLDFMDSWLHVHILEQDKPMVQFLVASGEGSPSQRP